jgi:LPS sulfotransferase NodH
MGSPEKFVLLGHPRSGSTLLTVTLQSHPDIRMFGELFHAEAQNRLIAYAWGVECRPSQAIFPERTRGWVYTEHQEGERFLDELVFADSSEDRPHAIGFKFFYDHARSGRARSAWDYLRRHDEVRVVHLVRENLLDCLLSTRTAEHTGVWEVEADAPVPAEAPTFTIPPAECEAYFDRITGLRSRAVAELFSSERRVLDLEYDRDILRNFDRTLGRIQEFLGVPPRPLPQRLKKQARGPARARIENYEELSRHFERTPFATYFTQGESPHA